MSKEYQAARNLVELNCKNCAAQIIVDGQDQTEVQRTSEWIQIVPADGTKFATCSRSCAIAVINDLPTASGITLV